MKVKLFSRTNTDKLENAVNEFLSTLRPEQIIDIKYSTNEKWLGVLIFYRA